MNGFRDDFPNPLNVPGVQREDDQGNDKTYEHEVVTKYWLDHYCSKHCTLCDNRGWIDTRALRNGRVNYCICPNGQAMRWRKIPVPR